MNLLFPHYKIGLISNGNSSPDRCGLAGYFSFIIFSQDVGYDKPEPQIFQAGYIQSGSTSHELMHVGDSLNNDVCGAANAGSVSVWLNRENNSRSSDIIPDIEIQSLTELPDILNLNHRN